MANPFIAEANSVRCSSDERVILWGLSPHFAQEVANHLNIAYAAGYADAVKAIDAKVMPLPARFHIWEIITMSDGRKVKRCSRCRAAYEFGHDMPCPKPEKQP